MLKPPLLVNKLCCILLSYANWQTEKKSTEVRISY